MPVVTLQTTASLKSASILFYFILFLFIYLLTYLFIYLFCFFMAAPAAHGSSQARGRIGATAAGLHHSHYNSGSELCL